MELRRPVSQPVSNEAQHAAAMRIQARIEAEEQQRRRAQSAKAFASFLRLVVMLGVVLLGLWAWKSGLLDSVLDREQQGANADLFTDAQTSDPAANADEAKGVSAVLDKAARSVQDIKDSVAKALGKTSTPIASSPKAVDRFAGAKLDYWKNAADEDRPGKDRPLTFAGLVPDGAGGYVELELEMGGGKPFAARKITGTGDAVDIDKVAFNKLIADTPYLVAREGRAYFCSPGKGTKPDFYKVPAKDGAFDPSREEFGALAACLVAAKIPAPAFKYEVRLVLEKLQKELVVATVGYGESVPRAAFETAARTLIDDAETCATLLAAGKVRVEAAK